MTYDAYISYAKPDAPWVRVLAVRLGNAGLRIFLDEQEISFGQVIVDRLEHGIASARAGLVVFSNAAVDGMTALDRAALLHRSAQGELSFIPVLRENVPLPWLVAAHRVADFSGAVGDAFDEQVAELVRALREEPWKPANPAARPPDEMIRYEGPGRYVLQLGTDQVALSNETGEEITHRPDGLSARLESMHWELPRTGPYPLGREMGNQFLSGTVGERLTELLAEAESVNTALQLGMEICGELNDLPWEMLILPRHSIPLALHPNVRLFRRVPGMAPRSRIPGPLRILAVAASPEGQESLDYEAEEESILDAVDAARRKGGAHVRILGQGSLEEIRDALRAERFHILHLCCATEGDALLLEDADGSPDPVTAELLVREALPPDRGVALIVLSRGTVPQLVEHGVPMVVSMGAPIANDLYALLASSQVPDPLTAFCDARRSKAATTEWATPTLYLRGPALPLYDPEAEFERIRPLAGPVFVDEVPLRPVGDFVGRRTELRALRKAGTGFVLHGLGGAGKSSLAAELLHRRGGPVVSAVGRAEPEHLLYQISRHLLIDSEDEQVRRLAVLLNRPDDWRERIPVLRRINTLCDLTLLLDDFEANLRRDGERHMVDDDLAEFLTAFINAPGRQYLAITSRYAFDLPENLFFHHLGPLSWPECRKLMWRLPALDALSPADQLRVYRTVGGHPRTLEYLDALLGTGKARFPDIRNRMEALASKALKAKGIADIERWFTTQRDLDTALGEAVTLTVNDALLERLIDSVDDTSTRHVLVSASVYRHPVSGLAIALAAGHKSEPTDAITRLLHLGLLTPVLHPKRVLYIVHRWTAETLRNRAPAEWLRKAHEGASAWWIGRAEYGTRDRMSKAVRIDEARHHARQAADLELVWEATLRLVNLLIDESAWNLIKRVAHETLAWFPPRSAQTSLAHHWLGRAAEFHADFDGASTRFQRSLRLAQTLNEDGTVARNYYELSRLARIRGDLGSAAEFSREALSVSERTEASNNIASCYHELGMIAHERGEYAAAEDWYQRALEIFKRLDLPSNLARVYNELGSLAQARKDYDTASRWYTKSLELNESIGERPGIAHAHNNLGLLALLRGDNNEAVRLIRKSVELKEELGDWYGLFKSFLNLGATALSMDDKSLAANWYRRALELGELIGRPEQITRVAQLLATLPVDETGLEETSQALDRHERLGEAESALKARLQLAHLCLASGRPAQALNQYRRALVQARELRDHPAEAACRYGMATAAKVLV